MQTKFRLTLATLLISLLAACQSGVKLDQQKNATTAQTEETIEGMIGSPENVQPVEVQEVNADVLNDPKSPLAKRSVYFDYDDYAVKSEYQELLQKHAQYLKSHPKLQIRIQGNTDERGTKEYNVALGQKRAEAVKRVLITLGVTANQLEAVSLGKEKPQSSNHDENGWSQNRRADLTYFQ